MAKSKIHREDGLLSAQMLNGIPEVDLGINTKLSNIERTEAAKRIMGMCSTNKLLAMRNLYVKFLISYGHLVKIYGFSFLSHLKTGIRAGSPGNVF